MSHVHVLIYVSTTHVKYIHMFMYIFVYIFLHIFVYVHVRVNARVNILALLRVQKYMFIYINVLK